MPLSAQSFTRTRWLGFFAELTAKLTHHNVLVVMEGCEMLKRVLMTRISIVAVLQEGNLLSHFLNAFVGSLQSERSRESTLDLNTELTYSQLETLLFCVDLMVSLHADGDAYDKLLVVARAGPMVEILLEALQQQPKLFFGLIGRALHALLRLPLGRPVAHELSEEVMATGSHPVAVQKHVDELRQLCLHHGPLLQDAVDSLTVLVATTVGAQRFCVMELLNATKKRLRKFRLRQRGTATSAATPGDKARGSTVPAYSADMARDDAVTNTTNRHTPARKAPSGTAAPSWITDGRADGGSQYTRDADFEVELDEHLAAVNLSTAGDPEVKPCSDIEGDVASGADDATRTALRPGAGDVSFTVDGTTKPAEDDVSGMVDHEPSEVPFELPRGLIEDVLTSVAAAQSHLEFFGQLDNLWCLAVADLAAVSAQLTSRTLAAVERFLRVAPNTRQDRLLFASLLLWTGHVVGGAPLQDATARDLLLGEVSAALWRMLAEDLREREAKDARARSERANLPHLFQPSRQVAQERAKASQMEAGTSEASEETPEAAAWSRTASGGDPVPADLLPYAMSYRTTEERRLQLPSVATVIAVFFLSAVHDCRRCELARWMSTSATGGDAWHAVGRYLQRVVSTRSVLLDAPTTVDGTLSEELYLSWSLKGAVTDDLTMATLSSKLVAAFATCYKAWCDTDTALLRDEWRPTEPTTTTTSHHPRPRTQDHTQALEPATLHAAATALAPVLMHIGIENPTLTCSNVDDAASALYCCPVNPHATRYTTLGESTLVALEACVALVTETRPAVEADEAGAVDSTGLTLTGFLLPSLPALLRVTRDSLHATVRAVPFRLLSHLCRTAEDAEAAFTVMPSLWRTAAASVLRCGGAASQWQVAAAAEWLVSVILRHGALVHRSLREAAAAPPQEHSLPSGVRVVREMSVQEAAWTSLGQLLIDTVGPRLLDTIASSPLCYAATALTRLALVLQQWEAAGADQDGFPSSLLPEMDEEPRRDDHTPPLAVLLPRGATSLEGWATVAQKAISANRRLARVSSLLTANVQASSRSSAVAVTHHSSKDASQRAMYSLETLATQYAYTATLCAALDSVLHSVTRTGSPLWGSAENSRQECLTVFQGCRWIGELLAGVFALPSPHTVNQLVAHRVGLAVPVADVDASPLARAYDGMVAAAAAFGTHWLREVVLPMTNYDGGEADGGTERLAAMVPFALLESVGALWCGLAQAAVRTSTDTESRTSVEAVVSLCRATHYAVGVLLSALLQTCSSSAQGTLLLAPLEPRAAALLHATTTIASTPHSARGDQGGVLAGHHDSKRATPTSAQWEAMLKAVQCHLIRCFSGANAAARASRWLLDEAVQLEKDIAAVRSLSQRGEQATSTQGRLSIRARLQAEALPPCLARLSLLTSVMSYAPSPREADDGGDETQAATWRRVQQCFCAALCEAIYEPSTTMAALQAVRCLTSSEVGRRCLVHEISSSGEPVSRTAFGRVLVLTFEWPTVVRSASLATAVGSTRSRSRPHSSPRPRAASSSSSPRALLRVKDANVVTDDAASAPKKGTEKPKTTPLCQCDDGDDQEEDRQAVRVGFEICTLACRAESTLFVPYLLKCRVFERASDLVVLHDLRWRTSNKHNASTTAQVRAHFYFSTPHWERSTAERSRGAMAHEDAIVCLVRLLRFLATVSFNAEAQRWLFRQAPLLTVLLDLAGDAHSGEVGLLALLVVRNLCFHPALKTVLCQDMRLLITLKAVAMGLETVEPLIVAPADGQSTVAALAATATSARRRKPLRDTASGSLELPGDDSRRDPPVAGALAPELRPFLLAPNRTTSPTHASSSSVTDWATGVVTRGRAAHSTATAPPSQGNAGLGKRHHGTRDADSEDVEVGGMNARSSPVVSRLRRQALAVGALWSLLFDHQRGKLYVKQALAQEPRLDVAAVCHAVPRGANNREAEMALAVRGGLQHIQNLCAGAV